MSKDKELVKDTDVEEVRRSFEYAVSGEDKTFYLDMPTSEQIRQAEWHYSKIYNRALVEGVATTSEMVDILTKRGIYGPEYETKLQELQVAIALKLTDMQAAGNDEDRMQLAREIQAHRDELYRWNQRITGPLSNSCEQMADDAKTEYLTSVVIRDQEGTPIWDSYDSFVTETNQGLALKSRFEVLLWLQGLDSDFLEKTPENQMIADITLQQAEEEVRKATPELPAADVAEDAPAAKSKPKKRKKKPAATKAKAASAAE